MIAYNKQNDVSFFVGFLAMTRIMTNLIPVESVVIVGA